MNLGRIFAHQTMRLLPATGFDVHLEHDLHPVSSFSFAGACLHVPNQGNDAEKNFHPQDVSSHCLTGQAHLAKCASVRYIHLCPIVTPCSRFDQMHHGTMFNHRLWGQEREDFTLARGDTQACSLTVFRTNDGKSAMWTHRENQRKTLQWNQFQNLPWKARET